METGIDRYFREAEEAAVGYQCICQLKPHANLCTVWNRRKRLEEKDRLLQVGEC